MRVLAVDTTSPSGSVALLEDDTILGEVGIESPGTHSSRLIMSIDILLKSVRLAISDLDGFAVTPGPGSFTGIRIGISTVKALAFASGLPIAPVSTLLALAWKLRGERDGLVCPLVDAKKGEIYAALYEVRRGRLREIIPQGAYAPGSFLDRLPARRTITFIGSGAEPYRDLISSRLKSRARISPRSAFIACEAGRLGLGLLRKGKGLRSDELEPLYFRRSQAEEGRERKS